MYLRALLRRCCRYLWSWRLRVRPRVARRAPAHKRVQDHLRSESARATDASPTVQGSAGKVIANKAPVRRAPAPVARPRPATRGFASDPPRRQSATPDTDQRGKELAKPSPVGQAREPRRQAETAVLDAPASTGHPCSLVTSCHAVSARLEEPWPACVRNLSRDALRLVMKRRFEPGTFLRFDLENLSSSYSRTFFARVIQARAESGGEWALECTLSDCCDEEEMQALLA